MKIKQLEFFEREANKKEKTIFDAAILEIKNHGMFVELKESLVFGLVPTSSLKDDLYHVSNDGTELFGRRTKKRIRVGETVQVIVSKVDRFKRLIDFNLATTDEKKKSSPQNPRERPPRRKRRN